MQNIGEATLAIPDDWQNSSVNIFTPSKGDLQGLSVTITREKLPFGKDLPAYAQMQLEIMQQQLPQFALLAQGALEVNGRAAWLMELRWESPQAGAAQQIVLLQPAGAVVLHCCASFLGTMDAVMREQLLQMLLSLRVHDRAAV